MLTPNRFRDEPEYERPEPPDPSEYADAHITTPRRPIPRLHACWSVLDPDGYCARCETYDTTERRSNP